MANYRQETPRDSVDISCALSSLAEPLMAYEDISDMLSDDQEMKLVDYVRACCKMSHDRISRRYDHSVSYTHLRAHET